MCWFLRDNGETTNFDKTNNRVNGFMSERIQLFKP